MVTDQARTGVPPGAEMPVAPLPGRRSSRQAGQVILWLLLLGLAAAAVYVMLDVVMASAAGLGPHSPGPPTPPGPRTQPGPGTAGKLTRSEGAARIAGAPAFAEPRTWPPLTGSGSYRKMAPALPLARDNAAGPAPYFTSRRGQPGRAVARQLSPSCQRFTRRAGGKARVRLVYPRGNTS